MRLSYAPLVTLAARHRYFSNRVARSLHFAPTPDGAKTLLRLGWLWRAAPGGGFVLAEPSVTSDAATRLVFALRFADPAFLAYTTPAWRLGWVWLYRPQAAASGALKAALGAQSLALKSRLFAHRFGATQHGRQIAVARAADAKIVLTTPAPSPQFDALTLDLSSLDEGRYQLQIDNVAALDFYLSDADPSGLWGLVELDAAFARGARFVAAFGARRVFWRYVVLGGAPSATLSLTARDAARQPVSFRGPSAANYGGRAALCFQSAAPIALSERPGAAYAMSLAVADGAGAETNVALPYADPAQPFAAAAADGTATSEIFVNL
jgi:hypothetical protein